MKLIVSMIIASAVVFLASISIATADVPHRMYYQGHLTDEDGAPVDSTISMTFTIYDDEIGGVAWWSETRMVEVVDGLFAVQLGEINSISDTVFRDEYRWLGIQVGSDPEISPKTKLVTVPYAFRVATVDGASGGSISGSLTVEGALSRVGIGVSEPSENLVVGKDLGSFSGNRIVVGDTSAGGYSGIVMGENSNNRGWVLWNNDEDFLGIATRQSGDNFHGLSIDSGRVGVGTNSPTEDLHVIGDIYCTGKLTSDGGNDPPYVLYNKETRKTIIKRVSDEVPKDKLDGAVLFWNGDDMRFEVYLPAEGEFRDIQGNLLARISELKVGE